MFEKFKGNLLFKGLLKRPNINKAYAMVKKSDPWYDTIVTVHNSLAEIQKLKHSAIKIKATDGIELTGIYYPSESDITVICVHGYRSHAEREWAFPGLFYHSLGYNVLIPYQRAHGLSQGKYIAFGAKEYLDMLEWVKKVNEINPSGKIIIHGLSMGGGIVLDLASREMENVKCLISDAPSLSIEGFIRAVSKSVFKKNDRVIADYAISRFNQEFQCDISSFEREKTIVNNKYPLLLCAGSKENMEDSLKKLKISDDIKILILPGCSHGNGMYKQTELFQKTIKEFIENNLSN